jgi:hypothetical protein
VPDPTDDQGDDRPWADDLHGWQGGQDPGLEDAGRRPDPAAVQVVVWRLADEDLAAAIGATTALRDWAARAGRDAVAELAAELAAWLASERDWRRRPDVDDQGGVLLGPDD